MIKPCKNQKGQNLGDLVFLFVLVALTALIVFTFISKFLEKESQKAFPAGTTIQAGPTLRQILKEGKAAKPRKVPARPDDVKTGR